MNELFSLFFGTVAITLIISGLDKLDYKFWIGSGISLYGMLHVMVDDILIHRCIKTSKKACPVGWYLNAISQVHRNHYKSCLLDGGDYFGLLWIPGKHFRK